MLKRFALAAVLAAALIPLAAVAAVGAPPRTVSVKDNFFAKKSLTIKRGTRVTWVWHGTAPHNVTLQKGPGKHFRSPTQVKGHYPWRFSRKGTYHIVCTIHATLGMRMTIRVR